ncbi:hypothetical protein [Pedobacter nanyangensis]|nr:hypothetical protein [Pedobacter nanyangensis]
MKTNYFKILLLVLLVIFIISLVLNWSDVVTGFKDGFNAGK